MRASRTQPSLTRARCIPRGEPQWSCCCNCPDAKARLQLLGPTLQLITSVIAAGLLLAKQHSHQGPPCAGAPLCCATCAAMAIAVLLSFRGWTVCGVAVHLLGGAAGGHLVPLPASPQARGPGGGTLAGPAWCRCAREWMHVCVCVKVKVKVKVSRRLVQRRIAHAPRGGMRGGLLPDIFHPFLCLCRLRYAHRLAHRGHHLGHSRVLIQAGWHIVCTITQLDWCWGCSCRLAHRGHHLCQPDACAFDSAHLRHQPSIHCL